jgi:hypothetical protein
VDFYVSSFHDAKNKKAPEFPESGKKRKKALAD